MRRIAGAEAIPKEHMRMNVGDCFGLAASQ